MMSLYITHRQHEFIIPLPLTTHQHIIVHPSEYHIMGTVVITSLIMGLRLGLGLVVVGHELTL